MDYHIYVSFYVSHFLITWLNAGEMDFISTSVFFTSVIFELLGLLPERWIIISTSVFTLVICLITWLNAGEMDYHIYVSFFTSVIFELLGLILERWIIISTSVFYVSHF